MCSKHVDGSANEVHKHAHVAKVRNLPNLGALGFHVLFQIDCQEMSKRLDAIAMHALCHGQAKKAKGVLPLGVRWANLPKIKFPPYIVMPNAKKVGQLYFYIW